MDDGRLRSLTLVVTFMTVVANTCLYLYIYNNTYSNLLQHPSLEHARKEPRNTGFVNIQTLGKCTDVISQ